MKFLRLGYTQTWDVPVTDPDGDIVRCRWARSTPINECAAFVYHIFSLSFIHFCVNRVCNGLPGASLNSQTCTMNYTATTTGFWVVALKIEDFEFAWQTTPLSGVSIQFMVIVYSITNNCTTRRALFTFYIDHFFLCIAPSYVGPQSPSISVIVDMNSIMNDSAQFLAGCENVTIVNIDMVKPQGQ